MKLSVVIVNYNVQHFLELCLRSVDKAAENIASEIIVVDNASSDNSCAMVKQHFPQVKLLENKDNLGFSKANNIGVSQAKGTYVLILNPDTVVGETTFDEILSFAEDKKDLGALGVQLVDGTGAYLPESKREIPSFKSSLLKMLGVDSNKNSYYAKHVNQNEAGTVSVLVGAFMLMKKKCLRRSTGV